MLFWTKTKPNKETNIREEVSVLDLSTELEDLKNRPVIRSSNSFAPVVLPEAKKYEGGCSYPFNIKNQFPLWTVFNTNSTEPNLSDFIQSYYDWLTCGTKLNITPNFGFFELEKLKEIQSLPKELLQMYREMYIPSLPKDALDGDVSETELKILLTNIYNKLYLKKGSEYSFRYLIALFFGVNQTDISMIFPKKYLMVLNGGINHTVNGITPLDTMGRLNYSVMRDSTIWNEFSYVINVKNTGEYISKERFERLIKPILHPAGLKDYYQEQKTLLESISEVIKIIKIEIPKIYNYFFYDQFSTTDVNSCYGCSYDAPNNVPTYKFPSWSKKIAEKYPSGVSFGMININDFWELQEHIPDEYPNDNVTCTGC